MKIKYLLLSGVLLWSCSKKQELPAGIYNHEEMVGVLLDIYIAQAKVATTRNLKRDSSELLYQYYQNYILQNRGTDTTAFYNSLSYYFEHSEDFEKINEIVLDSLNLQLEKLEAQEEKTNKEKRDENVNSKSSGTTPE
ncbi:MAG: DUF4296 domain-containing protein [Cyclobacteriaceae bacterium]|nr:DUF4296 domain-containing protein [Cyclobacteriaceae bacterium]